MVLFGVRVRNDFKKNDNPSENLDDTANIVFITVFGAIGAFLLLSNIVIIFYYIKKHHNN